MSSITDLSCNDTTPAEASDPDMKALREFLLKIPQGPIGDTKELEHLLARCWDQLEGGNAESMQPYKLRGRMEEVSWQPPILTFRIERHGRTACGSSRADLHEWIVDTEACAASWCPAGHRQLRPANPRLDVAPLAKEIATAIFGHQADERLSWKNDGSVIVKIGRIIPPESAPNATIEGRRKRLSTALDEELLPAGWVKIRRNAYRPTEAVAAPNAGT